MVSFRLSITLFLTQSMEQSVCDKSVDRRKRFLVDSRRGERVEDGKLQSNV